MLSQLYVANFKSIGDNGINILPKPLTILTGPNGSGKSSILEALCLLSQSVGQTELNFSGEFVKYGSPQSFMHKGDLGRLFQVSLTIAEASSVSVPNPGVLYGHRYSPSEVLQRALRNGQEIVTMHYENGLTSFVHEEGVLLQSVPVSTDSRFVLHPGIFQPRVATQPTLSQRLGDAVEAVKSISIFLRERFFFISAFRGGSEFFLNSGSATDSRWVGTDGSMTNQILAKMFGSRLFDKQAERVATWAEKFGLGGLKAGWAGSGRLRSDYIDTKMQDAVLETALASHGSRQALSFITQIFWSTPGTTLIIEEPEISLHPESQTLLPFLFAEAANRGVQIIVTTHSPFLISSLWKPVSEKAIAAKEIAVYHFEKGESGSSAMNLEVGSDGRLKEWIPSFEKVESKILRDVLESAPGA